MFAELRCRGAASRLRSIQARRSNEVEAYSGAGDSLLHSRPELQPRMVSLAGGSVGTGVAARTKHAMLEPSFLMLLAASAQRKFLLSTGAC